MQPTVMASQEHAAAIAPPTGPALEARKLSKRYGDVTALQGLELDVWGGDVFCLLGANGAGKSTTINLFLGFIEPTSGEARIHGIDVASDSLTAKRYTAYIPEQVMLYGNLTGLENLAYFAALARGSEVDEGELRAHLARVGLDDAAVHRRVGTYSKGMRQKVGIAIALAKNASALLLDEPTAGLDPKASNEFSELLAMLRDRGAAILMATHDLFRAKESGTRIGIMRQGRLVETLRSGDIGHTGLEQLYLHHMRGGA
jgi:ABC-2 type transport system ATP-binding protein